MTTPVQGRIRRYVESSREYLENALNSLRLGEPGKASEFLWGSMAEALQALAARRDIRLSNHRSLRFFASTVAKELSDSTINDAFVRAELLHSNFHEVELEVADVAQMVEPIVQAVEKLLALIPPDALEEAPST